MSAIGLAGTVALIGMGHPYAAGGNARGYLFFWAMAVTALFFARRRGWVRITATVFAVIEGLVAFGSMAFNGGNVDTDAGFAFVRMSPGPFGLVAVIAVIALLFGGSADRWFSPGGAAPGSPRPPRDPGKPLLRRRPYVVGLLITIVVVIGFATAVVIGNTSNTTGPGALSAGDCVATEDDLSIGFSDAELVKVGCSDVRAQAKVIARIEGTDKTTECRKYEDSVKLAGYIGSGGGESFVLCLRSFS
ncbi:LppU/SCO3897 family protein [Nocardia sp. NPDC055002]